ncbi:MAG TPA: DUF4334 domain-containing protein [Pseudonocardia sp.]|nr:DUF4334 domain-containing protein [Pseudonocardia sp.]
MERAEADAGVRLRALGRGATTEDVLAFFDALPPVRVAEMTGVWRGCGLPTGHRLDGLLERFGWYGKRVDGPEGVHPLLFDRGSRGVLAVDPAVVPLSLVVRYAGLLRNPVAAGLFRLLRGILRTSRPRARMRMTEYRGVVSATLCYDALPVHDVFRRVDDDTVLGLMDMRGSDRPFAFVLRREARVGVRGAG